MSSSAVGTCGLRCRGRPEILRWRFRQSLQGLARSSTLVVGSGVGVAARDLCKAKGQEMQCKCQWLVRVFQTRFVERDSCFSRSGANRILEPLAFDEALPLDLHM